MPSTGESFRCAVDGPARLAELREAPLPAGLRAGRIRHVLHRDLFLDTDDRTLERRGLCCRLRFVADGRRYLALIPDRGVEPVAPPCEAQVTDADLRRILEGRSLPARRLRGVIDPALLGTRVQLETERWIRPGYRILAAFPEHRFGYDSCTVRQDGLTRTFEELFVERLRRGGPSLDVVAAALEHAHGLRPLSASRAERAAQLAATMASEAAARLVATQRAVVLLCLDGDRVAFVEGARELSLPLAWGSGEEACRYLLRELFNSGVGELSLLGYNPGMDDRPAVEVWIARRTRGQDDQLGQANLVWLGIGAALERIQTPGRYDAQTVAALALVARLNLEGDGPGAGLGSTFFELPRTSRPLPRPELPRVTPGELPGGEQLLNPELSQLAFLDRVLDLAEQRWLPVAERLRYCAISGSLLDEFFSTRVAALRAQIAEGATGASDDGLGVGEQLDAIAARVPLVMARQERLSARCLGEFHGRGGQIVRWDHLDPPARALLRQRLERELVPVLTPRAVSASPGHPFPVVPHLTLSFIVVLESLDDGPAHIAFLPIPGHVGRFVAVPGGTGLVPVEDLVRANIDAFYPGRVVEQAWLFRLTRGTDLDLDDDDDGSDLLQSVEEDLRRRLSNAPVRLEVERAMPGGIRNLLVRELRFERRGVVTPLGTPDVYPVSGWIDLTLWNELADTLPPEDRYPPLRQRQPFGQERLIFEQIDHGDLLVQHPVDDFEATVVRLVDTAARDPLTIAIKTTLYRVGDQSPIIHALVQAAERGVEVFAFVEVRARLDEARNAQWVKRLEAAGVHVVYGIVGLKTHAKASLVIRRTPQGVRSYVHIGTGNYNAGTARVYTDLGLFTADPQITADVIDLFNTLSGSTVGPRSPFRKLLVAPDAMFDGLVERIRREVAHVHAGRPGLIRAQLNGLDAPDLIGELYRASGEGVVIQLLIRGLCTLRPGVPGLSDRITVKSVLGRFLEHQRIIHFGNGGLDEYWIGSADWRTRNLHSRIEILAPISRRDLKVRLGGIFDRMWAEPTAWVLGPDGRYHQPPAEVRAPHVHEAMFEPSWPFREQASGGPHRAA